MAGSDDDGAVGSGGDVCPPRDQSGRVIAGTEFHRSFRHFVSPRGAGVAGGFSSDDRPVGDALGVTGATFPISSAGKGVAARWVQSGQSQVHAPSRGIAVAHVAGEVDHAFEFCLRVRAGRKIGGITGGVDATAGDGFRISSLHV